MSEKPLLRVEDLGISFITRSGVIQAINDVSFEVNRGESFGLVGETGCGKSQTALALMRLTPDAGLIRSGKILFDGRDLTSNIAKEYKLFTKTNSLPKLRRNKSELKRLNATMSHVRGKEISMIFQEPMTSLDPVYAVGRQIAEALLSHSQNYLIDRILARNKATKQQISEIAGVVSRHWSNLDDQEFKSELHKQLERFHLEGLEDQVTSILGRKDISTSRKMESILALASQKVGPRMLRLLSKARESDGKVPIEYRILDRIPLLRRSFSKVFENEARNVSLEILFRVNMPNAEVALDQYPHELSGGMRQRVMIAMAIATRPKLVIADEPTSALDVTVQAQILDLLRYLKRSYSISILFISHDLGVISEICDRIGVMYAGNIVEVAPLDELFANSKHPYTQGLLAAIPRNTGGEVTLQTIKGTVPDLKNPPKGCRFKTRCPFVFDRCNEGPPWVEISKSHSVLCWLYGDSAKHVNQ